MQNIDIYIYKFYPRDQLGRNWVSAEARRRFTTRLTGESIGWGILLCLENSADKSCLSLSLLNDSNGNSPNLACRRSEKRKNSIRRNSEESVCSWRNRVQVSSEPRQWKKASSRELWMNFRLVQWRSSWLYLVAKIWPTFGRPREAESTFFICPKISATLNHSSLATSGLLPPRRHKTRPQISQSEDSESPSSDHSNCWINSMIIR